jgi:hypothetical protein
MMANRFRRRAVPLGFAVTAQALLLLGGVAGEAAAQGTTSRDVQRGVTVNNRPRPDYDPLGVRLGAFRLDGLVEVAPGFDSNLFGRTSNVVSDGFVDESVALNLQSQWSTHAVGAEANMTSRQYFKNSALDFQDWGVGGFGRYDFSADTSLEGRYRHSREHLDVYSFDVQTAGISQPVPYDTDEVSVTGNTRFNRVGLLGTGIYRSYRFQDVTVGGVRNPVSVNDFDTAIGAVGVSYAVAQGRSVTGVVRLQDISYTNTASHNRDSFTWEALLGFEYDFDGVWQGRIAVGWRHREYQGPGIKPLEGPAVEGQLTWLPTQLTTVRFNISRTIEESIRRDAVSFQRMQGGVAVDHELLRNVILGADFRADRREYQSPNQTATDALLTLTTRYLLNRNVQIVGSYTYSRRIEASGGLPEYDRNLVQVRLRFAI